MADIYDQHRAAFKNVSAFVVLNLENGAVCAKIAFKYPKDGAGRLYAYVHWLGTDMTRGSARGGGYDKHSAAVDSALNGLEMDGSEALLRFVDALNDRDGYYWTDRLRKAGFAVIQAV